MSARPPIWDRRRRVSSWTSGSVDVATLAETIAANAPLTLRAAKAAIRFASGLPNAMSLDQCDALAAQCFDSDDYMEGRAAFLEKWAPMFRGR